VIRSTTARSFIGHGAGVGAIDEMLARIVSAIAGLLPPAARRLVRGSSPRRRRYSTNSRLQDEDAAAVSDAYGHRAIRAELERRAWCARRDVVRRGGHDRAVRDMGSSPPHMAHQLRFSNGNVAPYVVAGDFDVERLLEQVGLPSEPRPVIIVCGSASGWDEQTDERATAMIGTAVSVTAAAERALVLDGGTDVGIMRVLGRARARRPDALETLVGVAPEGKVRLRDDEATDGRAGLEPNHSQFILAPGTRWGDETPLLFHLAAGAAESGRVVVLLVGGGEVACHEAREAVRRGWPLIVIQGFGGLADRVAAARDGRRERHPAVRELACNAGVFTGGLMELTRWIAWELSGRSVLRRAWREVAAYDARANRFQRHFRRLQQATLTLGIVVTALAIVHAGISSSTQERNPIWFAVLHWSVVVLPGVIALLVGWLARRAIGKQWVLFRSAAETIKSETFRYRAAAAPYGEAAAREDTLAARLKVVNDDLNDSEAASVWMGPLRPPPGPPSGASLDNMTAERYVEERLTDQLHYYRSKVRGRARWRDLLQALTLVSGAAGTVIAAAGWAPFVALTTAIAAAASSYLTSLQFERDVVVFNQTATELQAAHNAWAAVAERRAPAALPPLVERTEEILVEEQGAWTRRMARALDDDARRRREEAAAGA
jgi:hypothetical protein